MGNHWIVLINKSPRGPLTFEEVSILLKDNVIKRTDLALQISIENREKKSDWKFLWQYSEFDLRGSKNKAESSDENTIPQNNRRNPSTEKKIKAEISAILPDEIAMINPEDLVVSNQRNRIREGSSPLILGDEGIREDVNIGSEPKASGSGWKYWGLGSFMLVAVFYWKSFVNNEPGGAETSSLSGRSLSNESTVMPLKNHPSLEKAASLSLKNTPIKPQSLELINEKPPGRNEISLEDYKKLKEERAGKERLEEEDQRRENEQAAMLAAENEEEEQQKEEKDQKEESLGNAETEDTEQVVDLPLKKRKTKKLSKLSKSKKRKLAEETEEDADRQKPTDDREKEYDSEDNNRGSREP